MVWSLVNTPPTVTVPSPFTTHLVMSMVAFGLTTPVRVRGVWPSSR